jgi:2-hydroxy-3-keto-5-methylthiopentenyl-1-phosphate phosphatase
MGVVSACAMSFISKYLHQFCGPKPMTRVDISDNNQYSNNNNMYKIGIP